VAAVISDYYIAAPIKCFGIGRRPRVSPRKSALAALGRCAEFQYNSENADIFGAAIEGC
jgi:hypothetical protein